ncbi:MAG: alkaline phosphatase D family protein, partial [Candidatus Kapabacteria bacterium]|nr:alkaline phosphatase D family protein [Candidatus Kapabacteria bacterium]
AVGPGVATFLRPQIPALTAVFEAAFYGDVWNNYPAQRTQIANLLTNTGNCAVVLSGDFHTSFSFDGNRPSAANSFAEFIAPSVTSSNFDENLNASATLKPLAPALIATIDRTLRNHNAHLQWFDLTNHGYLVLDLTAERAQSDWFMVDTILARSNNERWAHGSFTSCGPNLQTAELRAPGKAVQDVPAPPDPVATGVNDEPSKSGSLTIIGHGANPATTAMYVNFVITDATPVSASLHATDGSMVLQEMVPGVMSGMNAWTLDLRDVASGRYTLVLEAKGVRKSVVVVVQR